MVRFVCATGIAVTLLACEGEAGPPGPPGPPGALVVSSLYCQTSSAGLSIALDYGVVRYSNGDAETRCAIWNAGVQYSSSYYHRAGQQGAVPGTCFLVYDLDTPSTGFWMFTSDPSERAVYNDAGSASNGFVVSFPPESCGSV